MNLRKTLETVLKRDTWIPYEGPYGGKGWMNVLTGEIRYQDEKPGENEGSYEDEYGQQYGPAGVEGEPGDTYGEPDDDFGAVDFDQVNEGDEVIVENGDQSVVAEIASEPEEGDEQIDVDMGEMGITPMPEHAVLGAPQQPPPDGFADGWQPVPQDHSELENGQTIEIYDSNAGEYVEAEIRHGPDEWEEGTYLDAVDENGEIYEFLDGQGTGDGEGAIITAAEDLSGNTVHYIDEWGDLADLEEGNYVQYEAGGEMYGAEVEDVQTWTAEPEVKLDNGHILQSDLDQEPVLWQDERPSPFEGDDQMVPIDDRESLKDYFGYQVTTYAGDDYDKPQTGELIPSEEHWAKIDVDGEDLNVTINDQFDLDYHDLAAREPDWNPPERVFPSREAGLDMLDGTLAQFEHPVEGPVSGEVDVSVDDAGNRWFHLDEDTSFVDNPDHPSLYVGDSLESVDNPWTDAEETDPMDDLKVGDYVDWGEGDAKQVDMVGDEQVKIEGDWYDTEQLAESADRFGIQDPIEPPDAYNWKPAIEIDDNGHPDLAEFNPEDTVYYYDEETGSLETGFVENPHPDDFSGAITEDGTRVDYEQMEGYASTGQPPLPEDRFNVSRFEVGYEADVSYINDHGELVEVTGMVTDHTGGGSMTITDEDGEQHRIGPHDDYAITRMSHDPDTARYGRGDGVETPTEEVVEDLRDRVDLTPRETELGRENYLKKMVITKEQQRELKSELAQWFNPGEVESFYDQVHSWKSQSANQQKLASAFAYAHGLESRVRNSGDNSDIPYSKDQLGQWVDLAEVTTELSRDHYEEHVGEWYRGSSQTALRSFIDQWAENPDAQEYNFDGRALNNGDDDPGNTWKSFRIAPGHRVDRENIMLATDMMFNPEGNYSGEAEIWASADGLNVRPDEIHVDHNSAYHFDGDIEDWKTDQLRGVGTTVAKHYDEIRGNYDGKDDVWRGEELSDQQVETLGRLAARMREENVDTQGAKEFIAEMEVEAEERGLNVQGMGGAPSGFDEVSDYTEDMEIVAYSTFAGEPVDAVVTDVWPDSGVINAEDEMGNLLELDPQDVQEVVWSPDGSHEQDDSGMPVADGYSLEDFEEAVGDWEEDGVEVMYSEPEWGDTEYGEVKGVYDGELLVYPDSATEHEVDPDDIMEITDDGTDQMNELLEIPDPGDYPGGHPVETEDGFEGYVQYTTDDAVYVEDNGGQTYGYEPQDIVTEPPEQVEAEPMAFSDLKNELNEGDEVAVELGNGVENLEPATIVDQSDGEIELEYHDDGTHYTLDNHSSLGVYDMNDVEDQIGGSEDGDWYEEYQQAAEEHQQLSSGDDGYWDTYEDAQDALPFDVGDEVESHGGTYLVDDFDPAKGEESVMLYDEANDDEVWVSPQEIEGVASSSDGSDESSFSGFEPMEGMVLDHPDFVNEVEVTDVHDDGSVTVEDSSGFDYELTPEGVEEMPSGDMVTAEAGQIYHDEHGTIEEGDTYYVEDNVSGEQVEGKYTGNTTDTGYYIFETPDGQKIGVNEEEIVEEKDHLGEIEDELDSLMPDESSQMDVDQAIEEIEEETQVGEDSGFTDPVDPEEGDTVEIPEDEYDETLSEGDEVWIQWPGVGDGKPAEVTSAEDGVVGLQTDDGHVTSHSGKSHELHVPADQMGGGSSEGPDDPAEPPEDIVDSQPAVGEAVHIDWPDGGKIAAEVVDTSADPNGPITVQDQNKGAKWLLWPNGDIEGV